MTGKTKPLLKPCRISLRLTPDEMRIVKAMGGPQKAFDGLLKFYLVSGLSKPIEYVSNSELRRFVKIRLKDDKN